MSTTLSPPPSSSLGDAARSCGAHPNGSTASMLSPHRLPQPQQLGQLGPSIALSQDRAAGVWRQHRAKNGSSDGKQIETERSKRERLAGRALRQQVRKGRAQRSSKQVGGQCRTGKRFAQQQQQQQMKEEEPLLRARGQGRRGGAPKRELASPPENSQCCERCGDGQSDRLPLETIEGRVINLQAGWGTVAFLLRATERYRTRMPHGCECQHTTSAGQAHLPRLKHSTWSLRRAAKRRRCSIPRFFFHADQNPQPLPSQTGVATS